MVHSGAMPAWTTEDVDDLVPSTAAALEALCHGATAATFSWLTPGQPQPLSDATEGWQGRQRATTQSCWRQKSGKGQGNPGRSRRGKASGHTFQLTPPLTDIPADAAGPCEPAAARASHPSWSCSQKGTREN